MQCPGAFGTSTRRTFARRLRHVGLEAQMAQRTCHGWVLGHVMGSGSGRGGFALSAFRLTGRKSSDEGRLERTSFETTGFCSTSGCTLEPMQHTTATFCRTMRVMFDMGETLQPQSPFGSPLRYVRYFSSYPPPKKGHDFDNVLRVCNHSLPQSNGLSPCEACEVQNL